MCQFRTNLCITVVLILNGFLCDTDLMENMKGISKMANAVEKMFDMTLFSPEEYFPNHATCPDKFWKIINGINKKRSVKLDVNSMSDHPKLSQVKVAQEFNRKFKKVIIKNPANFVNDDFNYEDKAAVRAHMNAYANFTDEITSLFRLAAMELIEA